jgi:hypothetical protein
MRTAIYLIQLVFLFFFIFLFDILVIKNGVYFYVVLGVDTAITGLLLYFILKTVISYFNY